MQSAPRKKEKEAMTEEQQFVVDGNEKADASATEGAGADGGQPAAAEAMSIKQLRKDIRGALSGAT